GKRLTSFSQTLTVLNPSGATIHTRQHSHPIAAPKQRPDNDGCLHVTSKTRMTPDNGTVGRIQFGRCDISARVEPHRTQGTVLPRRGSEECHAKCDQGCRHGKVPAAGELPQ